MSTHATPAATFAPNSLLRTATIMLIGSLVINHLLRIVAVALLNPLPEFIALTSWGPVTIFTTVGLLGAIGVYLLLRRFTANAGRTFTIIAWVVLGLSLIPNLLAGLDPASSPLPGMTAAAAVVLAVMHVPPALFAIRLLPNLR